MSKPGPERTIKETIDFLRSHVAKQLLTKPNVDNRLNHVQALREQIEGSPESKDERLQARATKQASDLIEAGSLDYRFAQKKALYEHFMDVVRNKIVEPKITPEIAKTALLSLKAQFEIQAKARDLAANLTIRIEQATLDVARAEKEAAAAPAPAASSSPAKPSIDHVAIAKAALEGLTKELAEAKALAEKPTDIAMEHRDAFLTFVNHAQNVLPFIIQELQFGKPDDKLTQADIDAGLALYKPIADGKTTRLADVEKKGGKNTGIQARVAEWSKIIPKDLTTEEWTERVANRPYIEDETKATREERIRLISGLPFRRAQLDAKAVARDKSTRAKQIAAPVAKQLHELDDERRREFERLGIKPYSKKDQNPLAAVWRAATGAECWNTDFEDRSAPKSPSPPRRMMLDEGAPVAFPERKEMYSRTLSPLLERHLKIGVKDGLLVGKKTKETDEYWKPAAEDKEIDQLMVTFGKLKI